MNKNILALILIGFYPISQNLLIAQGTNETIDNEKNFYKIQQAWYKEHPFQKDAEAIEEDGPEELFKRWENLMIPRTFPTGNPINQEANWKEWEKFSAKLNTSRYKAGDWTFTGPFATPGGNSAGNGRVNCITLMPGNNKTIFVGTPAGGLWKSTDGGLSWKTNTDNLPNLGVTDLAINPKNTNIMYMATGDGYGYIYGNNYYYSGATYSLGVMKSIDGGTTWQTTGLNFLLKDSKQVLKLVIYPENPDIVFAASSDGIWRTENGGANWTNVKKGNFKDIELNVKNHAEVYISGKPETGSTSFYYSQDTGKTWNASNLPLMTGGTFISTTAIADSVIYALGTIYPTAATTYLYRSIDRGRTWVLKSYPGNSTTFQGFYDLALAASPTDPNVVVVGGVEIIRSANGGSTWNILSDSKSYPYYTYAHADHRVLMYYPGRADSLLDGNDGGIFRSVNGGSAWNNISSDIQAMQFYRLGSSFTNNDVYFAGAQDNGINKYKSGVWNKVRGSDGMECLVNWNNNQIVYSAAQSGYFYKSYDGGESFGIYPLNKWTGQWLTPIKMNPWNPNTLFFGTTQLYRSGDAGKNWQGITAGLFFPSGYAVNSMAIANTDTNTIYFSVTSDYYPGVATVYRTTNGGSSWKNISSGLPTGYVLITDITIDPRNSKLVYACFSGYNDKQKVYRSLDGGDTWTNFSDSLPNFPVNCLIGEGSDANGIYAGTDIGVFYRNDNSTGWEYWGNGLPNTMVREMEIIPLAKKIRVATYGRGVWEAEVSGNLVNIDQQKPLEKTFNISPNPSNGVLNFNFPDKYVSLEEVNIFDVSGKKVRIEAINAETKMLDLSDLGKGIYLIKISTNKGQISRKVILN